MLGATTFVPAQTWNLAGNTNLTATSKIGGTSATAAQNFPLSLYTYNAERIHINANVSGKVGFVGIGTNAPATRLHVNGVITATGGTSTDWNAVVTRVPAGTTSRVPRWTGTAYAAGKIYDNNTNVGIGAINSAYALNVNTPSGKQGINVTDGGININNTGTYGVYSVGASYGVGGFSSSSGIGVYGSGYYGTYGSGTTYGCYGSGGSYGVYGGSSNYGVYGSGNYGVYGSGSSYGVYGNAFTGVYGVSSSGYGGTFYSGGHGIDVTTTNTAGNIYAAVFHGNTYCYGVYSTSDRNMKKNIAEVKDAMSIISRLKPSTYEFKHEEEYASLNLPQGKHFGLIAQELEEVLPGLVAPAPLGFGGDENAKTLEEKEASSAVKGSKAIDYIELIPIMIKGMQEQDAKITRLEKENEQLQHDLQSCCLSHSQNDAAEKVKGISVDDQPSLSQNNPNPFTEETIIHYYLPSNTNAVLKVMSLDGQLMSSQNISKTGYGEVHISANTLSAGTYTYTLFVNNKAVESKIMVVTR